MEINYLIDTNIFLEILLDQEKKEKCKKYLNNRIGFLNISDFSLHSIGVILFKSRKDEIYQSFINDTFPRINLLCLPKDEYDKVLEISKEYNLDFDDSYQTAIADTFDLKISTLDKDFKKVSDDFDIEFLD